MSRFLHEDNNDSVDSYNESLMFVVDEAISVDDEAKHNLLAAGKEGDYDLDISRIDDDNDISNRDIHPAVVPQKV